MAPRSRAQAPRAPAAAPVVGNNKIDGEEDASSIRFKLKAILFSLLAPLPLIYLNLRCQQHMCILFQAPLIIPFHTSSYFSFSAYALFLGFVTFQALWSTVLHYLFPAATDKDGQPRQPEASKKIHQGFISLVFFICILIVLLVFWPQAITAMHKEHLTLLTAAWTSCLCLSFLHMLAVSVFKILPDNEQKDKSWLGIFYQGSDVLNTILNLNLKHFFYVNVGLIGWAILDLLIVLNSIHEGQVSNPALCLAVTQIMYICHTVYHESILLEKPYMDRERLGYDWLQKVVLFLPFFSSLVTYSAVVSRQEISFAVLLCDFVFFTLGFVVHTCALHQMQRFLKDPKKANEMDALPGRVVRMPNKKFLVSGYWSFVHKPDLLGLLIMWISWTVFGGVNAISLIVFAGWLFTMMSWAKHSDEYNKGRFQKGWEDYCGAVPNMLLPYLY